MKTEMKQSIRALTGKHNNKDTFLVSSFDDKTKTANFLKTELDSIGLDITSEKKRGGGDRVRRRVMGGG